MEVNRKEMLSALYAATGVPTWKAKVTNGQLTCNEPTDLPEGYEFMVTSVESVAAALTDDQAEVLRLWWESDRSTALEVLALLEASRNKITPPSSK